MKHGPALERLKSNEKPVWETYLCSMFSILSVGLSVLATKGRLPGGRVWVWVWTFSVMGEILQMKGSKWQGNEARHHQWPTSVLCAVGPRGRCLCRCLPEGYSNTFTPVGQSWMSMLSPQRLGSILKILQLQLACSAGNFYAWWGGRTIGHLKNEDVSTAPGKMSGKGSTRESPPCFQLCIYRFNYLIIYFQIYKFIKDNNNYYILCLQHNFRGIFIFHICCI